MQSTLIRFTSSEYIDSYLSGNLYLSSLSAFWDLREGRIPYGMAVTEERIRAAIDGVHKWRQDFSEGVIAQIPRNEVAPIFDTVGDRIIHDVRFRLSAYKYCNLLCFFRIDAEDGGKGLMDADNSALILRDHGIDITAGRLGAMEPSEVQALMEKVIKPNLLLSTQKKHTVQLPSLEMDKFGDVVIVIKDELEFVKRIKTAVEKWGEGCIMGDVRYHDLLDRVDPAAMQRNSVTIISSQAQGDHTDKASFAADGVFNMSILDDMKNIFWRGSLDKYSGYASQKEWRVCWLPEERNYEAKTLEVGPLEDIIDVVDTKNIRSYLLKKYRGYTPGIVNTIRSTQYGTESYRDFKERMKGIDGLGDFVMEIG